MFIRDVWLYVSTADCAGRDWSYAARPARRQEDVTVGSAARTRCCSWRSQFSPVVVVAVIARIALAWPVSSREGCSNRHAAVEYQCRRQGGCLRLPDGVPHTQCLRVLVLRCGSRCPAAWTSAQAGRLLNRRAVFSESIGTGDRARTRANVSVAAAATKEAATRRAIARYAPEHGGMATVGWVCWAPPSSCSLTR